MLPSILRTAGCVILALMFASTATAESGVARDDTEADASHAQLKPQPLPPIDLWGLIFGAELDYGNNAGNQTIL